MITVQSSDAAARLPVEERVVACTRLQVAVPSGGGEGGGFLSPSVREGLPLSMDSCFYHTRSSQCSGSCTFPVRKHINCIGNLPLYELFPPPTSKLLAILMVEVTAILAFR